MSSDHRTYVMSSGVTLQQIITTSWHQKHQLLLKFSGKAIDLNKTSDATETKE